MVIGHKKVIFTTDVRVSAGAFEYIATICNDVHLITIFGLEFIRKVSVANVLLFMAKSTK